MPRSTLSQARVASSNRQPLVGSGDVSRLLLETGDYLLLETGDKLLLEHSTPGGSGRSPLATPRGGLV